MVGGGQHGCCSGLRDTVRHSELPEHLCSGQLDGLLGEDLVVCQCSHGGSRRAHGGKRGVRARRLRGLRRKWQQLRLSPDGGTGGCDAGSGTDMGGGVCDWDASSGTRSGDTCGGSKVVKAPRCTGASDSSSTSGYATTVESLTNGQTDRFN